MTPRADRPAEPSEAAIRARLEAATPGPWKVSPSTSAYGTPIHGPFGSRGRADEGPHIANAFWDAEFIAHAPEDIAWLLARVAELEAMNQAGDHDMRALAQLGIDAHAEWEAERDALRAANGRLRDALQRVVALGHDVTGEVSNEACAGCIAVDALADAPKSGLTERLERVRRWRPGELAMVRNIEGEWVLLDEVRAALAQDDAWF